MQGGLEQHIPPQAIVMMLGVPALSYEPTHHTGVGTISVLAPSDFFINFFSFKIQSFYLSFVTRLS